MKLEKRLQPGERWTTDRLGLDLEPISLEDMISPEWYALEREGLFRRSWLYVGRAETVAQPGDYVTKEIDILQTSILITRNEKLGIVAYHNVCPHRGIRLVWDTYADRPTSGHTKSFVCKFHGLGYGTDGCVNRLTDPQSWMNGQGDALKLKRVPLETWNGFMFVNLTPGGPKESLQQFIGEPYWSEFKFPFEEMTERYSAVNYSNANWKTMVDGFGEIYHACQTHSSFIPGTYSGEAFFHLDYFGRKGGHHRQYITTKYPDDLYFFDYERRTKAGGTGPRLPFVRPYHTMLPPASNPLGMNDVGTSSNSFLPNFYIQFYHPGWYVTYLMVPMGVNKMRFEMDLYMPPSRNFTELLSHKASAAMFLEATLQDFAMTDAQQLGMEQRVFDSYPLNDEENCVKLFHQQIRDKVREYQLEGAKTQK
jgi:Rieske 2Fe-2S family protein